VVTFDTLAREKRSAIVQLAEKHGARNLRVFGSVARGDNSEASDVDLLAEFGKDRTLFDLIAFRLDLRDLLGVNVDVVTPGNLRYIRDNVLAEARPI
jgi:predicted nucleotidyltransferase